MGKFGWSYPPGCSGPPWDDAGPCEICGQGVDGGDCVCPECPVCGEAGNPVCYTDHGLVRTEEQKRLKEEFDRREEESAKAEKVAAEGTLKMWEEEDY